MTGFTDQFTGDDPPRVEIQQTGRWSYSIYLTHGLLAIGPNGLPWHRFGRKRAERKGRRELDRYQRDECRRANRWELR